MKIVFASSEALPYFKSGGLADVARSLPDALASRGHDVRIVHPLYSFINPRRYRLKRDVPIDIPWTGAAIRVETLFHARKDSATAVLLAHPAFGGSANPYEDDDPNATGRRFAVFCRAVLFYAQQWNADVVHLNDWQTGLVPAYALTDGISIPTVFSIHNLAYQGVFARTILDETGLPNELFRTENGLEFFGNVSFLKGGLALSHRLTTVSPTYAREIRTPEYGAGFDGLLRFRSHDLFGILNGIDLKTWNPAMDRHLPVRYDANSLHRRERLRAEVLDQIGFGVDRPFLVVISRLAHQKGIDLVLGAVPQLLDLGANLFILGDGDAALERHLAELTDRFPDRIGAISAFDDAFARRLYASADFFLMPSRYEPCGLGQMIAQRYGALPIVRATGGLRDTVRDGETGFLFEHATSADLAGGVARALEFWRGPHWHDLQRRCMQLDWSWDNSAARYEDVYRYAIGPVSN